MTIQTRVSTGSQRKLAENGQGVIAGKVKLMYYLWNNLDKIYPIRIKCSVCIWTWKNYWKVEEGFRDVGTVNEADCHPSMPNYPQLLCVLRGQKRTCEVGGILVHMDKEELTSSCYFLEYICYSYSLFIWQRMYLLPVYIVRSWGY